MLSYYFQLQYNRAKRWLDSLGVQPTIGFTIGVLLFIILSNLLFYKTDLAPYLYASLALSFVTKLSDTKRNEQLSLLYNEWNYKMLRLIENGITSVPFAIYLVSESQWTIGLGVLILSAFLSLVRLNAPTHWVIPTPFKRLGFEYIVGFRQYIWLVGLLYFIMVQGILVDNYNLAIVSMAFIFIVGMSFFFKPEHLYYVWIYNKGFHPFIKHKIWMASLGIFILTAPAVVALLFLFSSKWLISAIVYLIAMLINSSIVLAKYSSYPQEMNIPQTLLYVLSIVFPPLLPFAYWIFYRQAKRRLEPILSC